MAVGTVLETGAGSEGSVRLVLDAGHLDLDDIAAGHSVAVNGICLTVVRRGPSHLEFELSRATLECTTGFARQNRVNLEKSLRLADRLGGHLMGGHVDGVGTVTRVEATGDNRLLVVKPPAELMKYIARKGSIAINGVSLTVNEINDVEFAVNLIPHTLAVTNLVGLELGARVNLEVDMLARYVERFLEAER
jgi:riboflavin synthase